MSVNGTIFGNPIPKRSLKNAEKAFKKYAKKFKFDPMNYPKLTSVPMPQAFEEFGIYKVVKDEPGLENTKPIVANNSIMIGTIRMGFGHYRMALAIASAAKHAGLTPYWLDLMSFPDSAGSKTIQYLENLYNIGSRLSQKLKLFDKWIWEPITSQVAKGLAYTARDRALARLFEPNLRDLPKDIPFISSHPWTGHAAVHAGLKSVVAIIPDNYALAFHLVEG
ncbi:MAG TPA: hypothetical protein P5522_12970, partial [Spirochaetia bacterium]|nr:hypothetical protein [Spirochaetia bacterium]